MTTERQAEIDHANRQFWQELCGTSFAQALGLTDHTAEALRRFDDAYLRYYPYLLELVAPERMRGARVLEIGLGYGTLGQRLAEQGTAYHGLDIAAKPVEMMQQRLRMAGLPGRAFQGSCHQIPLPDASIDFVVSIGCFHHTGNVQRCLDETHRVLAPGGTAVLMVYNKYSFRQWTRWPLATLWQAARQSEAQRRAYDADGHGSAAPETVCLSIGELRRMLAAFEGVQLCKRNCDPITVLGKTLVRRERLLGTLGRWLGLDVYVEARKPRSTAQRAAA
jgi:SAM-dependent methyltransferase